MWVINEFLNFICEALGWLLPKMHLSTTDMVVFDTAIMTIISIINSAGYLVPLDTLTWCIGTILVFNNWKFLWSVGQKIISWVRG